MSLLWFLLRAGWFSVIFRRKSAVDRFSGSARSVGFGMCNFSFPKSLKNDKKQQIELKKVKAWERIGVKRNGNFNHQVVNKAEQFECMFYPAIFFWLTGWFLFSVNDERLLRYWRRILGKRHVKFNYSLFVERLKNIWISETKLSGKTKLTSKINSGEFLHV